MADHDPRSTALIPSDPRALSTLHAAEHDEDDAPDPPFDVATFDPNEFEWRPVPRRPRADGWTPEVQRAFIAELAASGMVEHAARHVDMSVQSAYRLRHAPGSESFARAWSIAIGSATARVLDQAFARVIEGEETPVFDRDGRRIGARRKVNEQMAMFLLRAYMPERFRHANHDVRTPGEAALTALPPLDQALDALLPPTPAAPHLLLAPDRLEALVDGARGVADVDALYPHDDRELYAVPRVEADHPVAIERSLARGKREGERTRREQARAAEAEEWDEDG